MGDRAASSPLHDVSANNGRRACGARSPSIRFAVPRRLGSSGCIIPSVVGFAMVMSCPMARGECAGKPSVSHSPVLASPERHFVPRTLVLRYIYLVSNPWNLTVLHCSLASQLLSTLTLSFRIFYNGYHRPLHRRPQHPQDAPVGSSSEHSSSEHQDLRPPSPRWLDEDRRNVRLARRALARPLRLRVLRRRRECDRNQVAGGQPGGAPRRSAYARHRCPAPCDDLQVAGLRHIGYRRCVLSLGSPRRFTLTSDPRYDNICDDARRHSTRGVYRIRCVNSKLSRGCRASARQDARRVSPRWV